MDQSKQKLEIPGNVPTTRAEVQAFLAQINGQTPVSGQYMAEVVFWALGGATYYWNMMQNPPSSAEIGLIVDAIMSKLDELESSHKGISREALQTRLPKEYGSHPRATPGGSGKRTFNILEAMLFEYERHTMNGGTGYDYRAKINNTKTDWNSLHVGAIGKLLQRGTQLPLPPNPTEVQRYHFYNWPELLLDRNTVLVGGRAPALVELLKMALTGEKSARHAGLFIHGFNSVPAVDNLRLVLDYSHFTVEQQAAIFNFITQAGAEEDLVTLLYKTVSHFAKDYQDKKTSSHELGGLLPVISAILERIEGAPKIKQEIASNEYTQAALATLIKLYTSEVRVEGGGASEYLKRIIERITGFGVPLLRGGTSSVLFQAVSYHTEVVTRIVIQNPQYTQQHISAAQRFAATPNLLLQLLASQKLDEASVKNSQTLFFEILAKIAPLTAGEWQQDARKIYADACLEQYANVLKLLLEKGIDVNAMPDQRHAHHPINPLLLLASNPILHEKCLLLALQKATEETIVYKPKAHEPVFKLGGALVEYLKDDNPKEWDQAALDIVKAVASKTKSEEIYKVTYYNYLFRTVALQRRPHNQHSRALCVTLLDAKVLVGSLPLADIQDDELLELVLDKGDAAVKEALNDGAALYNLIHRLAELDNISDLRKRIVAKIMQCGAHAAKEVKSPGQGDAEITTLIRACMAKDPALIEIIVQQQPEAIAQNVTAGRTWVPLETTPLTQYNGSALFYLLRNDYIPGDKRKELLELFIKLGADPAIYHKERGNRGAYTIRFDTAPLIEVLTDSERYKGWPLGKGQDIFCYLMENVPLAASSNAELVNAKRDNMAALLPMLANLLFAGSADGKAVQGEINVDRIAVFISKCDALGIDRNFLLEKIRGLLKTRLVADDGKSDAAISAVLDFLKCPPVYVGSLLQDFLNAPDAQYKKAVLFLLKRPEVAEFITQEYQKISQQPVAVEKKAGKYTRIAIINRFTAEPAPPVGYDFLAKFISRYATRLSIDEVKQVTDSMLSVGATVTWEAIEAAVTHTWGTDTGDTQVLDYLLQRSTPEQLTAYKNKLLPLLVGTFNRALWDIVDSAYLETAEQKKGRVATTSAKMLKLLAHFKSMGIDTSELEVVPTAEEEPISWSVAHYLYAADAGSAAEFIQQFQSAGHNPFNHGKNDLEMEAIRFTGTSGIWYTCLTLLDCGVLRLDTRLVTFALDKGADLNSVDEGRAIMPESAEYEHLKRANFLNLMIKPLSQRWDASRFTDRMVNIAPILQIIRDKRPGQYSIVNTEHAYEGDPYTLFGLLCAESRFGAQSNFETDKEKTPVETKINIIRLLFDLGLDVRAGNNQLERALNDAAWNPVFLAELKRLLTERGVDYSDIVIIERPAPTARTQTRRGAGGASGATPSVTLFGTGSSGDTNNGEVENQEVTQRFTPPRYVINGAIVLTASAIGSIPLILSATKVIEIPGIPTPGVPDIGSHISTAMIGFAITAIAAAAIAGKDRGAGAAAIAGIAVFATGVGGTALVEWAAPLMFTNLSAAEMHLAMGITYVVISIASAIILAVAFCCKPGPEQAPE